jgi:N-acyl amino acid synthase of PEP-CTERM/exosortase system
MRLSFGNLSTADWIRGVLASALLDLAEGFRRRFEVIPALSAELQDRAFEIRHQVYCEDLGFEAQRPDRRERDEYDRHSIHLLLRHVQTGEYVGCTRLVRARPEDPSYPLPFEKTCAHTLDRGGVDPAKFPRHSIAEVSRLAVIAKYRRRRGEAKTTAGLPDENSEGQVTPKPTRFPYILVGLYLGTVALAQRHKISQLFVLTEPRLAEHFLKLGVQLQQIGGPVEHRGTRVPSLMSVTGIVVGMSRLVRPLYREIVQQIDRAYPGS